MSKPERREYTVAVVGATGAVGAVLLDVLAERSFPVSELRPLASERSVGTTVTFRGEPLKVDLAAPDRFEGADLVFFAATGTLSRELGPEVGKRGGIGRPVADPFPIEAVEVVAAGGEPSDPGLRRAGGGVAA